jgi:ParB family chromosome partitioning protein
MDAAQLLNIQLIDRPKPPVRLQLHDDDINTLCQSIQSNGILVPLLVRRTGERYEVIDGDSRLEAAFRLRLREVPCVVRDTSDSETHVLRLTANNDRSNPDAVSEAIYIAKAIGSGALTAEVLAQKLHRSINWIGDRLAIAEMPEYMQSALRAGKLSLGVALSLYQIDNETVRYNYTMHAIAEGMTIAAADFAVHAYERDTARASSDGLTFVPETMAQAPPVVMYPCDRCKQLAPAEQIALVKVHRMPCPTG